MLKEIEGYLKQLEECLEKSESIHKHLETKEEFYESMGQISVLRNVIASLKYIIKTEKTWRKYNEEGK